MLPTAITLWNYRSFAAPVRLELRPITLLFGENNSGKSALLRALRILADSETVSVPLNLESLAARGSSFQDLLWKGAQEDEERDLGVSLQWEGTEAVERIEYRMTWFEEWRRVIVRKLSIWEPGGRLALEAVWNPSPDERSSLELTYEIRSSEDSAPVLGRLGFFGLAPTSSTVDLEILDAAEQQLSTFEGQVQWLTATRRSPDRVYPYLSAPRLILEPDGRDAPAVLAATPDLLAEVSAWYERNLRRRLRVQDLGSGRFSLMLQHLDRAALDTHLVENGEGSVQVLPVLAALALTRHEGPCILSIEEPESHLHPSLQRALAEHICDVSAQRPFSRIVLETHSEHFLLGVELQILQGRLRPDDVQVYWVHQLENGESVAQAVTLDENARLQSGWPPGVFSEDTEMAREILRARRERALA